MGVGERFDVRIQSEFGRIVPSDACVEKLATGFQFTEGPVWFSEYGGFLVFSDIPGDELKRWSQADGVSVFRSPSYNANGNTLDRQGRLVTCEHGSRTVTRTDKDGTICTLAHAFEGKRLNSPNDAVVKSDGSVWFTDPPYGINAAQKEQSRNFVFRFEPKTGGLKPVVDDFDMPNGLCFSPDEAKLYIADSGEPRHLRVFDVRSDGTLTGGGVFCEIDAGVPDGIRADTKGRVYSTAGDGVQIFAPDGRLIGKILVPEAAANCCFGGPGHHTLFITAQTSLYAIHLMSTGASQPTL